MTKRVLAWLLMVLFAVPAMAADPVASLSSPGQVLRLEVTINGEGRVGYAVSRQGTPVIGESHVGFLFADAPQMLRNFQLVAQSTRSFDETWEQPWGEWRRVRNRFNELTVSFEEKTRLKRRMTLVFRLFDDGVGFRYEIPQQPNLAAANIVEELTQFRIAEPGDAWWSPAFESNREEYLYNRTPVSGITTVQTPVTIRTKGGLHLSIHEAALVDYSGMNVRGVENGLLEAVLT